MPTRLDHEAFEACASEFDAAVEGVAGIDHFCSGSAWIVPFHRAFVPSRELHLYRNGSGDSFVALAERTDPRVGAYLEPLETMWQFPCPIAGPSSIELLADVEQQVAERDEVPNVALLLSGVPASGELARNIASALRDSHTTHIVDRTTRYVAALGDGVEGWLERRTASFRRNLRAAVRRGEREGLVFEHLGATDAPTAKELYARVLAIEQGSWKSLAGEGVDDGPMHAFYRDMLPRLAARGRLRVVFARRGDRDVGYLHGGLLGRSFRGLQMSFDAALGELSIGNLMQHEMISTLCEEGFLTYDLGSRPGYKERWAEEGLTTLTLLVRPLHWPRAGMPRRA